jgi:hypothetical protein
MACGHEAHTGDKQSQLSVHSMAAGGHGCFASYRTMRTSPPSDTKAKECRSDGHITLVVPWGLRHCLVVAWERKPLEAGRTRHKVSLHSYQ